MMKPLSKDEKLMKEIDVHVGKTIMALRKSKKLTRKDLATEINVSKEQLRKYEFGINRVSIGRLILIAKILGEPITYFCEPEL